MSSSDGEATAVSGELTVLLARLGELAQAPTDSPDAPGTELVDRIAVLEQARAALAAAQHTAMVGFARTQIEAQSELVAAGRLDPRTLGTDIAAQIGLAAHVSTWQGSRRLTIARTLATDLPDVRALLAARRISERLADSAPTPTPCAPPPPPDTYTSRAGP